MTGTTPPPSARPPAEAASPGAGRLILGTVQLGKPYGVANQSGQPAPAAAREMLAEARRAGVGGYDTAPNYGEAESLLGRFLAEREEAPPLVITKLCTMDPSFKPSAEEVLISAQASLQDSLAALGMESVGGLIAQYAPDLTANPCLGRGLLEFKRQGLAERVGVSAYSPDDARAMLAEPGMDLIQLPLNPLDLRMVTSGLTLELAGRGVMVLARSVFLQGLIFLDPAALPAHLALARPHLLRLRGLAGELGMALDELAVRLALAAPGVHGLVLGQETLPQLRRNLELVGKGPLEQAAVDELAGLMAGVEEAVVNPVLWGKATGGQA